MQLACILPSNQLKDDELYIGDDTTALLLQLSENEGVPIDNFYEGVRSFYIAFVGKLNAKFDFKSRFLANLKFIDPVNVKISFWLHSMRSMIKFDKAATKLEFREFAID